MLDERETLMKTGENTIAKCSFMLTIKKSMIYRAADTSKNKTKTKQNNNNKKKPWPGFDHKLS